jgi:hypothetical protein
MLLLLLPHTYYSSYLVGGFEDLYWQNNDSKSIVHVVLHLYTNNTPSLGEFYPAINYYVQVNWIS